MLSLRVKVFEQSFRNLYQIAKIHMKGEWLVLTDHLIWTRPTPPRTHLTPFFQPCVREFFFPPFLPQPAENNAYKKSLTRVSSCVLHFTHNMTICGLSYTKETKEAIKTSKKKTTFNSTFLSLTESMNVSRSTHNFFICLNHNFSTNGTAPPSVI